MCRTPDWRVLMTSYYILGSGDVSDPWLARGDDVAARLRAPGGDQPDCQQPLRVPANQVGCALNFVESGLTTKAPVLIIYALKKVAKFIKVRRKKIYGHLIYKL